MDDVITIFSSPAATRDPPPCVDLGVIEITDSEPEELDSDDLFWTGLEKEIATSDTFLHQSKDIVKESSPMDVDVDVDAPVPQAGPSTSPPALDPFPEIPIIHIQSEGEPQTTQKPDADPHSEYLALILEVIPDVLPKHAMDLIEMHHPTYNGNVVESVLQDIFDDPSYPKVENDVAGKGKGKRKASEMEDVLEGPPLRVKIDFASVDRPRPLGSNYRALALVSFPPINGPRHSPPG